MSNQIAPKGKMVRVVPDNVEEKTASGIITTTKKKTANTGVIVAVSPDYDFPVKVGDRVQYIPNHQEVLEDGSVLIRGDEDGAIQFIFN